MVAAGNLVAIAGLIALLTGLPGGDLTVQGFAYSGSHNWQVMSSTAEAGGDFAIYKFASGGYVDLTGLVRAGDWCAAPLTAQNGQVANAAEVMTSRSETHPRDTLFCVRGLIEDVTSSTHPRTSAEDLLHVRLNHGPPTV